MTLLFLYRNLTYLPLRLISPLRVHEIPSKKCDLWFHMASLGEVLAAKGLVDLALESEFKILITTFTKAGFKKAFELWGEKALILRFPWDSLYHVKKIIERISPRAFINLETELWPNTLYLLYKYRIPAFLVNARISEKNFKRIAKLRGFFSEILIPFVKIFTQTKEDAERLLALGAREQTIKVTGNIKIDTAGDGQGHYSREDLHVSEKEFVIIFSSLREKEEDFAVNLVTTLKDFNEVKLIFAPRHLNRVKTILRNLERKGISAVLWTNSKSMNTKVMVLNTLGELRKLYPIADLIIVGGTFAPYGGHNILEIAAAGKPALVGPYHFNIKNEVELIAHNKGLILVQDQMEAFGRVRELIAQKDLLNEMGLRAKESLNAKKGISKEIFEEILLHLQETCGN
ncbi:MAG: glycosyltransferase N-terminal domain-containing protein [candidate division WOR-3 bacterium]